MCYKSDITDPIVTITIGIFLPPIGPTGIVSAFLYFSPKSCPDHIAGEMSTDPSLKGEA